MSFLHPKQNDVTGGTTEQKSEIQIPTPSTIATTTATSQRMSAEVQHLPITKAEL